MADMSKVGELLSGSSDAETQPPPEETAPDADDPEAMGVDAASEFAEAAKAGDPARIWQAFKMMSQAASLAPADMEPSE